MRNTLTPNKLKANTELAKQINEPAIFGEYQNDVDFFKTIALFNDSTLETRRRGMFLLKKVLTQLHLKENLLDVGSGDGKLASWIGNVFKHVTMIDPSKEVVSHFNMDKRILRKSVYLNKVNDSILEAQLPYCFYDLSLLSHVLYYIPRETWLATVKKVYEATRKNGIVVVILSGEELGKANLITHYGGKPVDIAGLEKECLNLFGKRALEMFTSTETIVTTDLNSMLHISGFCLFDSNMVATKKSLTDYINKHFKLKEDLFEMTSKQSFLLIHKK